MKILQTLQTKWRKFLCKHNMHKWSYRMRRSKSLYFNLRDCDRCGLEQIQNIRRGTWGTISEGFTGPVGDWERKEFDESVPFENFK